MAIVRKTAMFGVPMGLAVGVAAWTACGPTPPPAPTELNNTAQSFAPPGAAAVQVEYSSAVMPSQGVNAACPAGRIFVTFGNQYNAERAFSADIACFVDQELFQSSTSCFTYQEVQTELAVKADGVTPDLVPLSADTTNYTAAAAPRVSCSAPPTTMPKTVQTDNSFYTDAVISRVNRTGLIHAMLELRNHTPVHPQPVINSMGTVIGYSCQQPFTTDSLAILMSSDCGNSWRKTAVFDINDGVTFPPEYAVPEYDSSGNSTTLNPMGGTLYHLDRPEIFVDSHSPTYATFGTTPIFISATVRSGPKAGTHVLFRSIDGGASWDAPIVLPGAVTTDGNAMPGVMTASHRSFVGGAGGTLDRLYVFRCEPNSDGNYDPMLYWSDDYGSTWGHQVKAAYTGTAAVGPLPCQFSATVAGLPDGDSGQGIVQVGPTDSVLIAYPTVDVFTNLQQEALVVVTFGTDGETPTVTNSNLIDETANNRNVI